MRFDTCNQHQKAGSTARLLDKMIHQCAYQRRASLRCCPQVRLQPGVLLEDGKVRCDYFESSFQQFRKGIVLLWSSARLVSKALTWLFSLSTRVAYTLEATGVTPPTSTLRESRKTHVDGLDVGRLDHSFAEGILVDGAIEPDVCNLGVERSCMKNISA
jgi:hypothetical protein